jgi:hypothetical protein
MWTMWMVCCAVLAWVSQASAQRLPHDYDRTSTQWNGLSGLVQVADQLEITLRQGETLDYAALDPKRPLLLIFPTEPLDGESLEQFLASGGRVLIADDFGSSGALLPRFQLTRVEQRPERLAKQPSLGGNAALPVLRADGRHPLLEGDVKSVVANHPAYLQSPLPAVLYFQDGVHGLAFDLTVGEGKLLVIADASLYINLMLEVGDNLQFVHNSLRYLCEHRRPCEIDLFVGGFAQRGELRAPTPETPGQSMRRDAQKKLTSVNDVLTSLEHMVPERRLLRALIMVLSVGLGLFLMSLLPGRAPKFLEIRFRPPKGSHPRSDFERHLEALTRHPSANQALPLSILREEFEALFWGTLYPEGVPSPEVRYQPQALVDATRRYGEWVAPKDASAQAVHQRHAMQLLVVVAKLPLRSQALISEASQMRWSEHPLQDLYLQAQRLLAPLTAEPSQQSSQQTSQTLLSTPSPKPSAASKTSPYA